MRIQVFGEERVQGLGDYGPWKYRIYTSGRCPGVESLSTYTTAEGARRAAKDMLRKIRETWRG